MNWNASHCESIRLQTAQLPFPHNDYLVHTCSCVCRSFWYTGSVDFARRFRDTYLPLLKGFEITRAPNATSFSTATRIERVQCNQILCLPKSEFWDDISPCNSVKETEYIAWFILMEFQINKSSLPNIDASTCSVSCHCKWLVPSR